jgi:hypothetical protein
MCAATAASVGDRLHFRHDFYCAVPVLLTIAAKTLIARNNPLMIRTRHWKSSTVLPTFRLSVIGA